MLTISKNASTNEYRILSSFLDVTCSGAGQTPLCAIDSLAKDMVFKMYPFGFSPHQVVTCSEGLKGIFSYVRKKLNYDIFVRIINDIKDPENFDVWKYKHYNNNIYELFYIIKSGKTISDIYMSKRASKTTYNDKDCILAGYKLAIPQDGSGSYNKILSFRYKFILRDHEGINIEATAKDHDEMRACIKTAITDALIDKCIDKGSSVIE